MERIFKEEKRELNKIEGSMNNKKGQVTIFVIIGVVLVVAAIVIFMFWPQIRTSFAISSDNPEIFLKNCLEDEVNENLEIISLQGGSLSPQHYFIYDGNKVEYLCYQEENYIPCVVQRPLLKNHIENEISNSIQNTGGKCLDSLKENLEKRGYSVTLNKQEFETEILPGKVVISTNSSISAKKDESNYNYGSENKLNVILDNNLYELSTIAISIISSEVEYGDSETTNYMNYYRDLKVEKKEQSEGTRVYILTDTEREEQFMFASRSVVFPPGYRG